MKVVSVINYKGGVGKTTLTACLAACLQRKSASVLMVDLDPQCNLTCEVLPERMEDLYPMGERQSESGPGTLREWYRGLCEGRTENLEELILRSPEGLSIIPSHLDLLDVDTQLAIRLLGTDIRAVHSDPRAGHQRYYDVLNSLRSQLRVIEKSRAAKGRGGFDLVLLDCPPNFNIITQTAIIASDAILIPTRPNPLSTMGLDHLIRKRGDLVRDFNASADAIGLAGGKVRPAKVLGIVSMIWKVGIGRTPIMGNRVVIDRLRELEGDGVVFYDGVCHNESVFTSKVRAPRIPFSEKELPSKEGNKVRELTWTACRKIGETLEIIQPSFEEVTDLLRPVLDGVDECKDDEEAKEQYIINNMLSAHDKSIGFQIKDGLRHIPSRGTDMFRPQIGKVILEKAMSFLSGRESLAKWVAMQVYSDFLRECGESKDDAKRKSSEFFERSD